MKRGTYLPYILNKVDMVCLFGAFYWVTYDLIGRGHLFKFFEYFVEHKKVIMTEHCSQ